MKAHQKREKYESKVIDIVMGLIINTYDEMHFNCIESKSIDILDTISTSKKIQFKLRWLAHHYGMKKEVKRINSYLTSSIKDHVLLRMCDFNIPSPESNLTIEKFKTIGVLNLRLNPED